MSYIKNIEHEKVVRLAEEVYVQDGQVISKTLAQNEHLSVTLFAFSKGEEIGTHDSTGDAMVYILDGTGEIVIDGTKYELSKGECVVMPANKPHSVFAKEDFKMMLTVVFPNNK